MANSLKPAALGFRAHTGWAALVAAGLPGSGVGVLLRERVEMIPGSSPDSPRFVYHAAAKLPVAGARRFVRASETQARTAARRAIAAALRDLAARGYRVTVSGVIVGNRPVTAALDEILAAHPLLHAAEGELFRQVLLRASEACGLKVTPIRAADLYARGVQVLGTPEDRLRKRLAEAGRAVGRPWALDQKEALLAGWIALAR